MKVGISNERSSEKLRRFPVGRPLVEPGVELSLSDRKALVPIPMPYSDNVQSAEDTAGMEGLIRSVLFITRLLSSRGQAKWALK